MTQPRAQSPPYVVPAELPLYGANEKALLKVSNDEQVAACQAATDQLDGFFADRYPLPFISVNDTAIKLRAAHIAIWLLLSQRGRNPEAGYDDQIDKRYEEAMAWGLEVARQKISLNVTLAAVNKPQYNLPTVITHRQRGWSGSRFPGRGGCW